MESRIFINIFFTCVLFSSFIFAQYPQMDFPLHIGNRWQFSEGQGPHEDSQVIGDTVMLNNIIYRQIEGVFLSGFFRTADSKVFSYSTISNTESLIYDFSLKTGDTLSLQIFNRDTVLTTVSSQGITTIFGDERYYMTFLRDELGSSGDGVRKIVDGLGFVNYTGEAFSYGLLGAVIDGTHYGVILQVDNPTQNIPTDFRLFQNYPNPFNPTTTIAFEINNPGFVKINIYDLLGNQLTTLLNNYENSGINHVIFNGGNLSSGIYFYTISYNNIIKTKSMVLLK